MKKELMIIGTIVIAIILIGISLFIVFQRYDSNQKTVFKDACQAIEEANFRSLELLEGGNTPEGPVPSYWYISFNNGTFGWGYSDVSETGYYECIGWEIKGRNWAHDDWEYSGYFNKETGILIWDGVEYEKISK